ncbi:hypothetical protein BX666DRAFT_2027201 [Dichotomocladium elegans]|nr:hypothetical protein BX666DRAFT_2027201 [Dichotomocladium elegans]
MTLGTIKSYPNNPNVAKALVTAAYMGVSVDFKAIDMLADRDEAFRTRHPMAKVPVFEGKETDLFESNAIAYYVALQKGDHALLGTTPVEKAKIMQWAFFSDNEITANTFAWIGPLLGYAPYVKPAVDGAIERYKRALDMLNKVMVNKTYLVSETVTFADIVVACALVPTFTMVMDKPLRDQYKNVTRYFTTVIGKPHFKAVLGEIKLCETPLKYTPPKKDKKETAPKKKEAAPKKQKPDADATAAPAAATTTAAGTEDAAKPTPKPKSKLDLLPKSPFILDEWKRMYSNNNTDVAMKWFWENFDKEGWSIWRVDYKYNDELTLVFMSNNLIGGFFNRLELARKYAFGTLVVTGVNNNNAISGYFVIRGQGIPEEVTEAADFESYNFTKIEPAQYEEKKDEIYRYMAWEVPNFADGKVFK